MAYRETERTRARKARTREAIVAAAVDQLAGGGYASASVQAVARRAGVATGSVYRHFPSKAGLFAEVFRRASSLEMAVFEEATGDGDKPAAERIAAATEAFARRALAGPTRAYALIAEPVDPAVEAERLAFREGYRDVLAGILDAGVASGELEPHDTRTVAAALVGALGEALVGPLSPAASGRAPRRRNEALVASLVQFCIRAVPTKEERRAGDPAHA
ncbi:MAG TPA: TetR/AcrR family transcriptional regulator [Thermoleophilaceae bacterium]|jgi:AcrR family transcriptional regulator